MGATTCDDNRFEAIAKAREMLVSSTNIEDSPDEMAVLDTILFRFWQMGWIDALDVNARLKAENAKLRDENERFIIKLNAEHIARQNVESENAKLREVCADLLRMAESHDPEWLHWPEMHDELRKLGVEVDA